MKRTAIILVALMFISFLFTSCQKAKETEGKKEFQAQKEEVKQQGSLKEQEKFQQPEPKNQPQELPKSKESKEKEIEGLYGFKVTFKGEIEKLKKYLSAGKDPRDTEGGYIMHVCDRFHNLSLFQDVAAIEITEKVIKTSSYSVIRACAAEAMGWYGNKKAVPVLLEALKYKDIDISKDVRLEAAGALLQLNEEVDAALETIDVLAQEKDASSRVLQKLYKWEKVFDKEFNNYTRTWRTLWNSKCEDLYRRALIYPSDEIKADAVWYFARKGEKELKEFIESLAIDILKRNKWERHQNDSYKASDLRAAEYVVHALEHLRSKKALPILKEIMKNPKASYVSDNAKKAIETIEKRG